MNSSRAKVFPRSIAAMISLLAFIVILTSWSFELAARRVFDIALKQKKISKRKRWVLDLLCTELKLNLQRSTLIVHSVKMSEAKKGNILLGRSGQFAMQKITECVSETVNSL